MWELPLLRASGHRLSEIARNSLKRLLLSLFHSRALQGGSDVLSQPDLHNRLSELLARAAGPKDTMVSMGGALVLSLLWTMIKVLSSSLVPLHWLIRRMLLRLFLSLSSFMHLGAKLGWA